jgi:hypothetical protein
MVLSWNTWDVLEGVSLGLTGGCKGNSTACSVVLVLAVLQSESRIRNYFLLIRLIRGLYLNYVFAYYV